MRQVRRLHTKVKQPRPPWEWRETWKTGAPRTCLTNIVTSVGVRIGADQRAEAGIFDWALRLYRHHGGTIASRFMDIDGVRHASYSLEEEWELLIHRMDWIELVDKERETVWRIDSRSARKYGFTMETARGSRWVVPLHYYTKTEQE